jgi:hypothetical protein
MLIPSASLTAELKAQLKNREIIQSWKDPSSINTCFWVRKKSSSSKTKKRETNLPHLRNGQPYLKFYGCIGIKVLTTSQFL